MQNVSNDFKDQLKQPKTIDAKITIGNDEITSDDINNISRTFNSSLFKTVAKSVNIDSNVPIEKNTEIEPQFGVYINNGFEYVHLGTYKTKDEPILNKDTNSYQTIAYDRIVDSMVDYALTDADITFPCTVRDLFVAIFNKLQWSTSGIPETFVNSTSTIEEDVYSRANMTYRDVLDELCTVSCMFLVDKENPILVDKNLLATITEETGTNIHIENAQNEQIGNISLKGDTQQNTTTGKNKLPNERATTTSNGITITKNDDGTYKVNGTATADVSLAVNENTFIPMSGTWRMVGCPSGGSASTYMLSAYVGYWGTANPNIDTGSGTNITYTGDVKVRFYIKSGTTCNNLIFKPMLTTDTSATYNSFEPYTNGASPNPDYPQEVKTVTGNQEINVCGKNMFNPSFIPTKVNTTISDDNITITDSSGWAQSYFVGGNEFKSGNYAIRIVGNEGTVRLLVRGFINGEIYENRIGTGTYNTYYKSTIFANFDSTTTVSLPNTCDYYYIGVALGRNGTETFKMMVENGTTATDFEPYQSQTYPIYLPVENLIGLDTSQYQVNLKAGDKITTKNTTSSNLTLNLYTNYGDTTRNDYWTIGSNTTRTITVAHNTKAIAWESNVASDGYAWINYGDNINAYCPYGTTPIELCKIGTYQDYIYKDNGKWYIHKEIGKVVLDGNSYIATSTLNDYQWFRFNHTGVAKGSIFVCDYLTNYFTIGNYIGISNHSTADRIYFSLSSDITTTTQAKSWLSTHNTIVYYVLATPTNTIIEDTELIEQLESASKLETFKGVNNITISSSNLASPITIGYVSDVETINEEYMSDTSVEIRNQVFFNSLVFSRASDSDNIFRKDDDSIDANGLHEFKVRDLQILSLNWRDNFIDEMWNYIKKFKYHAYDVNTVGISYLEPIDGFYLSTFGETYPTILLNSDLAIGNGVNEKIYANEPVESTTEYKYADTTDKKINQAYIIVDKQNVQIQALTQTTSNIASEEQTHYQEMLSKMDDKASISDIETITNQVNVLQTDTYTKTEINKILNGTDENGNVVSFLQTLSATLDENGMSYNKTGANTSSNINETGVTVTNKKNNSELLFAGYDEQKLEALVRVANLYLTRFLGLDVWRIEIINDPTNGKGLGFFYIG